MQWISQVFTMFAKPLKWWVVVAPWEQGIKVRLGKTAKRLDSGIHLRLPFLDRIYVQSIRLRTTTKDNQTISSLDGKTISISIAVQFAINDIKKLYNSVANPEVTLRTLIESKIAEFISTRNIQDITPAKIESHINTEMREFKDWGLGKLKCSIIGFTTARTYRLLMNDYSSSGGLYNIEDADSTGEK